jgi:electron transport complex protein RnfG
VPIVADGTALRGVLAAALVLGAFALLGTTLVAATFVLTRDRIAENERALRLAGFNALLPPEHYDNVLAEDSIEIVAAEFLGTTEPVRVYRAYKAGKPVALLATPQAPDGYGGPIKLLIAVYADGTLAGVRVLAHQETPGLGDAIDVARSNWILGFSGKSLGKPPLERWTVKKDGGGFDQFTGATITPRAVVRATRRFLQFFKLNRERLFSSESTAATEAP